MIRSQVAKLSNVQWLEHTKVKALVGEAGQVTGVRYNSRGKTQEVQADFVVDASGRIS